MTAPTLYGRCLRLHPQIYSWIRMLSSPWTNTCTANLRLCVYACLTVASLFATLSLSEVRRQIDKGRLGEATPRTSPRATAYTGPLPSNWLYDLKRTRTREVACRFSAV